MASNYDRQVFRQLEHVLKNSKLSLGLNKNLIVKNYKNLKFILDKIK